MMASASFKMTTRNGIRMTAKMFNVLQRLRESEDADFPFIHLPDVYKSTLDKLVEHDWIFGSPGIDGVRYKITARGEQIRKMFEKPQRRKLDNNLCQECQIRPRKVASTGYLYKKCDECEREHTRRRYQMKRYRMNPDSLCPDCRERPRHKRASGHTLTYCLECHNARRRIQKRDKQTGLLTRIKNGEVFMCRCGKAPLHHTDNSVYDYCRDCLRDYMNAYNDKRRPDSVPAKQRERRKAVRS